MQVVQASESETEAKTPPVEATPARAVRLLGRPLPIGLEIARLQLPPGAKPLPSHRQAYFQIVVLTGGNGVQVVDAEVHPARKGSTFLLAPNRVRFWRFGPRSGNETPRGRSPVSGYVLDFDAAFVASCASHDTERVLLPTLFGTDSASPLQLSAEQLKRILGTLVDLEAEYNGQALGRISALQGHLQLLLVQLARALPTGRRTSKFSSAEALVRDFSVLIERHYVEHLAIQRYADRLKVSEGHLCRVVRRQTGTTARDLVQRRVIVEAKRLLAHLDASIAEIATSLGFEDPAYFTRAFKKSTGQTPSEFRSTFADQLQATLARFGAE